MENQIVACDLIKLEHVVCDLCGCPKYKIRYRKPDGWLWLNQFEFPVVECTECGLVYVNPRPTPESMGRYYPLAYHDGRDSEEHQKRYQIQCEFLPDLAQCATLLDIGCARGDFLHYLAVRYPHLALTGVDTFSEKINFDNIRFIRAPLPEAPLDKNEFDVVTSWAVFEHLHTPSEYFRTVNRVLKQRGRFIFLVTNAESLYGTNAYMEDIPRHTYHFSKKTLGLYAQKFGFNFSRCIFDDRIFDGRGVGTFFYAFEKAVGVGWNRRSLNQRNRIQRLAGKIGKRLDRIIFRYHWEQRLSRSGIMVCEFIKQ